MSIAASSPPLDQWRLVNLDWFDCALPPLHHCLSSSHYQVHATEIGSGWLLCCWSVVFFFFFRFVVLINFVFFLFLIHCCSNFRFVVQIKSVFFFPFFICCCCCGSDFRFVLIKFLLILYYVLVFFVLPLRYTWEREMSLVEKGES